MELENIFYQNNIILKKWRLEEELKLLNLFNKFKKFIQVFLIKICFIYLSNY